MPYGQQTDWRKRAKWLAVEFWRSAVLFERNAFTAQFEVRWEFFCPNNIENIARPSGTLRAPMPKVIHFFLGDIPYQGSHPDRTHIEYCQDRAIKGLTSPAVNLHVQVSLYSPLDQIVSLRLVEAVLMI